MTRYEWAHHNELGNSVTRNNRDQRNKYRPQPEDTKVYSKASSQPLEFNGWIGSNSPVTLVQHQWRLQQPLFEGVPIRNIIKQVYCEGNISHNRFQTSPHNKSWDEHEGDSVSPIAPTHTQDVYTSMTCKRSYN